MKAQFQPLDKNVYYPRIGVPGEVDTVVGNHTFQYLGWGLLPLSPEQQDSNRRVIFSGLPSTSPFLGAYKTGKDFNLKSPVLSQPINIDFSNGYFGHFRDTIHTDYYSDDRKTIYWSDDYGFYDSSRYTRLATGLVNDSGVYFAETLSPHIVGDFSSTDLDDIIVGSSSISDSGVYSHYFELYNGGAHLYKIGSSVKSDSSMIFDEYKDGAPWSRIVRIGDFRGAGRKDIIGIDHLGNNFFYKNEKPFSFQKLINSLKYDTLLSYWDNEQFGMSKSYPAYTRSFQALPKALHDKSEDYIAQIYMQGYSFDQKLYFFKGELDFGRNRLTLPTADEVFTAMQEPEIGADPPYSVPILYPVGDITGSGEPVVGTRRGLFFVLGNAFNQKIDMVYSFPWGTDSRMLPLVNLDGDALPDIIYGHPDYQQWTGTIHVLHGSTKIPVNLNPKYVEKDRDYYLDRLLVYPNPASSTISFTFTKPEGHICTVSMYDMLGQIVLTLPISINYESGIYKYSLLLPEGICNGFYTIRLSTGSHVLSSKISVVR